MCHGNNKAVRVPFRAMRVRHSALDTSGVHRTHHQEYIKLLVQVIVSEQQHSSNLAFGHVGGRLLLRYYVLYQKLAVTVLCTPDDGCDGHPKHVE